MVGLNGDFFLRWHFIGLRWFLKLTDHTRRVRGHTCYYVRGGVEVTASGVGCDVPASQGIRKTTGQFQDWSK
jgi:hypothetical protein